MSEHAEQKWRASLKSFSSWRREKEVPFPNRARCQNDGQKAFFWTILKRKAEKV